MVEKKSPEKSKAESKKRRSKTSEGVIVALIGAVATLLVAIVTIVPQLLQKDTPLVVTPTLSVGIESTTLAYTQSAIPTATNYQFADSPQPSLTPTELVTLTSNPFPVEVTDDFGVQMAHVPSGEFTMGSDDGNADEQPVHNVFLTSFYMDKYEVTNSRYSACVRAGVCLPPIANSSETRLDYYGNFEFNNYPVIYVNLDMAKTYCAWRGARLPTEAEWEKAARGTDGRTYPWGESIGCDYLNFNKCVGDTTPVGSYEIGKSIYGLYDMAGNVWEWVADWYDENYYSISPFENPKGPPFSLGSLAIVRGGSWSGGTEFTSRITNRANRSFDKADIFIGFRCAAGVTH